MGGAGREGNRGSFALSVASGRPRGGIFFGLANLNLMEFHTEPDLLSTAGVRWALASRSLAPLHRLGQHFLVRPELAERMVDLVAEAGVPNVLEVGPGLGGLTGRLLARGFRVVAVELDRGLAAFLRESFPAAQIVEADVRDVSLGELSIPADTVFCGNLPYYLTAPLLRSALAVAFPAYVIMVQKEVGVRLKAAPGDALRGSLSVLAQTLCEVERAFAVPSSAFYPQPKVASLVMRLRRHSRPAWDPLRPISVRVLRAVFGHRRKSVRQSLRLAMGLSPSVVQSVLETAGIPAQSRPEDLNGEAFAALIDSVANAIDEEEANGG